MTETTYQQAQALVQTLVPVTIDGFQLTARVKEVGIHDVARKVNGKWQWVPEPAYAVVFEGGRWGSHTLLCATSSVARIAAHWSGYIASHTQHAERAAALRAVEAGAVKKAEGWRAKAGDKVFFIRGMYGIWKATIVAVRSTRRWSPRWGLKGALVVDLRYTGANGRSYTTTVRLQDISRNGARPILEM